MLCFFINDMRIGILTVPFNNNYGGYLQAYALMTILKQMGHEPTIIMRRHTPAPVSLLFRLKFTIKGICRTIFYRKRFPLIYSRELTFRTRGRNMLSFVNKYIQPQTIYIYSTNELRNQCDGKFDVYIVGSDQVWRPIYVPGIIGNMFLDFTEGWDVKRFSYAASFGTDNPEYTEDEKQLCGRLIERFDGVSVREESGANVIDNLGWHPKRLSVVLDPTLLLNAIDYNKLLHSSSDSERRVFCYVLDQNPLTDFVVESVCNVSKLKENVISNIQTGKSSLPSVEDWLTAIRDAEFVVTDSFHGTVFSIIFNKPFVVCANTQRGFTRFEALLATFGLSNRIINKASDLAVLDKDIDWNAVNRFLLIEQNKSKCFLNEMLNPHLVSE